MVRHRGDMFTAIPEFQKSGHDGCVTESRCLPQKCGAPGDGRGRLLGRRGRRWRSGRISFTARMANHN